MINGRDVVNHIRLIWDDRDPANTGWYCRLQYNDEVLRDEQLDGTRRAGIRHLLPQAKAEARTWGLRVERGSKLTVDLEAQI